MQHDQRFFDFLTSECASFLHYEIFQSILENYDITKHLKRLQYSKYLEDFIQKHKIADFATISPQLKDKNGTKEFILKFDIESTCELAKVTELKKIIAEIMDLNPLTFEIIGIEEGCVVVTFLIPASVADAIFTPSSTDAFFTPDIVFTPQQEDKLQAASVLWLKCNGHTIFIGKSPGTY